MYLSIFMALITNFLRTNLPPKMTLAKNQILNRVLVLSLTLVKIPALSLTVVPVIKVHKAQAVPVMAP